MTELKDKLHIRDIFESIETSNNSIKATLSNLPLIYLSVRDIPQFPRGEELPDVINVKPVSLALTTTLNQCISPQGVHRYTRNLPKRFEGIVQFMASESEYQEVARQVKLNTRLRKELVEELKALEPESRARSALTKKLFPDVIFQTLHRHIPLMPYDTKSITTSWCTEQVGLKKLQTNDAKHLVEKWCETVDYWRANQMRDRLKDAGNVYKKTRIRTHPQAVVKYLSEDGRALYQTCKIHSPLIILSPSAEQIRHEPLETYKKGASKSKPHDVLKRYDQLIEGSCLYYRMDDTNGHST